MLLFTVNYDPATLPGVVFRDLLPGQQGGHVEVQVRGPEALDHEVDISN